jgi:NADH-quinone oxidoreductase subunit J
MGSSMLVLLAGAVALTAALAVVFQKNPVYSALSLALSMLGVALLFLSLGAEFLAAVQIIVYAGAVVVLFLFVLMFLGIDREESLEESLPWQRFLGIAALIPLTVALLAIGMLASGSAMFFRELREVTGESNVANLAEVLFTDYIYPFELTSALVVTAAISLVVLARRRRIARANGEKISAIQPGIRSGSAGHIEAQSSETSDRKDYNNLDEAGALTGGSRQT